jgi:hypothetical protein
VEDRGGMIRIGVFHTRNVEERRLLSRRPKAARDRVHTEQPLDHGEIEDDVFCLSNRYAAYTADSEETWTGTVSSEEANVYPKRSISWRRRRRLANSNATDWLKATVVWRH